MYLDYKNNDNSSRNYLLVCQMVRTGMFKMLVLTVTRVES